MNLFQKFIYGIVTCRIKTQGSGRFFNICHAQNIFIHNVYSKNDYTYFSLSISDFRKLKPIAKKTHIIPHIIKKFGLPVFLHKYKHKFAFLICIFFSLFLLLYISTFIWNIEYIGNVKYSDDKLSKALYELGINTGQKKSHINTDMLEEELRLKFDDIAWVSATIDGTVLKIYFKEALITNAKEEESIPGDIVADVDCIIESIVTRNGTPQITKGQSVQAGDLLISGIVTLYNDDQTIKEEHFVCADGDVYGKYIYTCNDYYPKWTIDKSNIYKTNYGLSFTLFNKQFNIGNMNIPGENAIQIQNNTKYRLTHNFYLPFKCSIYKNHYYYPQKQYYSDEQVIKMANKKISEMIMDYENNKTTILKNNLQIVIEEEYYKISGSLEISAPIGKFIPCQ